MTLEYDQRVREPRRKAWWASQAAKVCAALAEHGGAANEKEIRHHTRMSGPMVGLVMARLEESGAVCRCRVRQRSGWRWHEVAKAAK